MKRIGNVLVLLVLLALFCSPLLAERVVKVEALSTDTDTFRQNKIQLGMVELAAQLAPFQPYVLLAGDADGQQIQGVAGSNKPRLNLAGTELNIYGDGSSPAQIQIQGGYVTLSTPDNFSSMYIGNLDASIQVSTDGTAETLSFLRVDNNGVEIDVHDGVAQFQMNDNGTMFTGAVFRLNSMTVPTTASDPCFTGAVAWDSGFWYVCVALDTWKRTALSTW